MTTTAERPPFPEPVESTSEANGLKRLRSERAPFDFRATEWAQYGQSGTRLYMAVHSDRGGVSVTLMLDDAPGGGILKRTTGGGVAWHDAEGEELEPCTLLASGKCHGGISYLAADAPAALYDQDGEDAVWDWLEHEYRITYEDKDATS